MGVFFEIKATSPRAMSALIGLNDARKRIAAHRSVEIDHAAALKTHPEVLDFIAMANERHSGINHTIHALAVRRGEDLFGGHIREERVTLRGLTATALPTDDDRSYR